MHLECCICFEEFNTVDRRPKLLPCGHTLCQACVIAQRTSSNVYKCPSDRMEFPKTEEIKDNFYLLQLLGSASLTRRSKRLWCLDCQGEAQDACDLEHTFCTMRKIRVSQLGDKVERLTAFADRRKDVVDKLQSIRPLIIEDLDDHISGDLKVKTKASSLAECLGVDIESSSERWQALMMQLEETLKEFQLADPHQDLELLTFAGALSMSMDDGKVTWTGRLDLAPGKADCVMQHLARYLGLLMRQHGLLVGAQRRESELPGTAMEQESEPELQPRREREAGQGRVSDPETYSQPKRLKLSSTVASVELPKALNWTDKAPTLVMPPVPGPDTLTLNRICESSTSGIMDLKEAVLSSDRAYRKLAGMNCSFDPMWCRHFLESKKFFEVIEIMKMGRDHFKCILAMPNLQYLIATGWLSDLLELKPIDSANIKCRLQKCVLDLPLFHMLFVLRVNSTTLREVSLRVDCSDQSDDPLWPGGWGDLAARISSCKLDALRLLILQRSPNQNSCPANSKCKAQIVALGMRLHGEVLIHCSSCKRSAITPCLNS